MSMLPRALALDNGWSLQMGWNSWNHFHGLVSAAVMRETTDQFVALGLRDAGYVYINSDGLAQGEQRTAIGPEQIWALANGTITGTSGEGGEAVCLTAAETLA